MPREIDELSRLEAIANAATSDKGGWPTRPGDQLRRFQPANPDPDQLAPTHLGGRWQSAR